MKQKLLLSAACCAAILALAARSYGDDESTNSSGSWSSGGAGEGGWKGHHHPGGPMGAHMSRQDLRSSKISGASVQSTSGQVLGTISDTVVNPGSGHIDLAILSLSSSTSGGEAATAGQLVPVPWMLLRPAGATNDNGAMATASTTSTEQPSFVYTGDTNKLQNAPSFSQSSWPDISQPAWRHSIFSYYGMKTLPGYMGGAETPGGDISGARGGDQDLLRGNAATNSDTVTSPFSTSTNQASPKYSP